MAADMSPVSTALENDVLGEVRRRGVVVWLDKDGHYSRSVDGLRCPIPRSHGICNGA